MRRGSHGCACLDASPTTASARKLNNLAEVADLAHEVVQEVQRERIVGLAVDDARVRAAEARAGQAGAALHAAPTGLAQRAAALDDAKAEPTRGSGPPTNATAWPTSRCVADQEDRTTALGPRLRLGLPRDLCRAPSCWPCDGVVWAVSLPCSGPLTRGR